MATDVLPDDSAVAEPRRPGRRRRRRIVIAVVLAVLAVGGGVFGWRWYYRGPHAASVGKAVEKFRASSTIAAPTVALRPPAGVYTYAGSGSEHLSFLATSQSEGPTVPGTVTHGEGGCWTFEIAYNSFHRQSWQWCARDGRLYEEGGVTHQQFDFVAFTLDETSRFTCDPPFVTDDPKATRGAAWPTRCTGHSERTGSNVTTAGTIRFVGRDTLTVGGERVPALHYRIERTLSGDQTGSERLDVWFSVRNALPVRNERTITVKSPAPAPLNSVTYTERGEWHLSSPLPRT